MKPTDKIEKLLKNMNVTPEPERDRQMLEEILQAQAETNNQCPEALQPGRWSIIMRNPITKYAAAAMLFFAVILGVNLIPGTKGPVALASIIKTFQNAICISYDMKMGEDSIPIHDTVYQNMIRREVSGTTAVIDLDKGQILTLMESEKQAVIINFDGVPELPKNYVDHIVNLLSKLDSYEDVEYEPLGQKEVDGKQLTGHLYKYDNLECEIWIDDETSLPAMIAGIRPGLTIIAENFNFNEELDLSLFSMEPPEGYMMIDAQNMIDFKKDANEDTFIEGLRLQAYLNDGWFPIDISIESFMKRGADIGVLIEQKFEGTLAQMQAGMTLGKGLVFLRFWNEKGPWHYAGNGVQLGQTEEPIFWYQPKDSNIFRVIFGDLHIENIAPEDIDELVADRVALAAVGYQLWDKNEYLTGQDDECYVKAGNMIEMHSTIDIRKGPMDLSRIILTLPYDNAKLISAAFGDTALLFENNDGTEYAFFPDDEQITTGQHIISLVWQFPLENLEKPDGSCEVALQSFLPATSYKITAILDTDCGYTWNMTPEELEKALKFLPTKEPDNPRMLTLFTIGKAEGKTTFGTCGFAIKPE